MKHASGQQNSREAAMGAVEDINLQVCQAALRYISDTVLATDDHGHLTYVSPNAWVTLGQSVEGIRSLRTIDDVFGCSLIEYQELTPLGEPIDMEHRFVDQAGEVHDLLIRVKLVDAGQGTVLYCIRDITQRRQIEREIKIANEILEAKHSALQQKNLALRSVIEGVAADKRKLKEEIWSNFQHVVMPVVRQLRQMTDAPVSEYVELLQSCLEDIMTPFVNKLEKAFSTLSPAEIEICNMIRRGLSSKEIAALRNVSIQTVNMQRKRIRKKLGVTNKGGNLQTLLNSLLE